ncbi:MAG TPA: fructosamine kinase family protein [Solirubrobacteraceae bacterium]|jgi:fructosamine-3-kinase
MNLPSTVSDPQPIGGGSINQAWRVRRADGTPAFLKMRPDVPPGEYQREAAGLQWLAETGALALPGVLEVSDRHLLLEWVEPGSLSAAGELELGRGLARIHAAGAPCFGDPGLGGAAGFGSLALSNEPTADWAVFYARQRLAPLAQVAAERGALSPSGAQSVGEVCERLGELSGPVEPPARLHGDLWVGNVLGDAEGRPWLIDPSVYGGHREMDLAMLRLFGHASERIFDAYQEVSPLAEGWRERVGLWQLAPLLVHAVLFGGSYGQAVERTAQRYRD